MTEAEAEKALRAVRLAMGGVVVALIVLAIDYRLKKFILDQGQVAMNLLLQATALAEEARDGKTRAAGGGTDDLAGVGGGGGGSGVVPDGAPGADVGPSRNGSRPAPAGRPVRAPRRVQGDG